MKIMFLALAAVLGLALGACSPPLPRRDRRPTCMRRLEPLITTDTLATEAPRQEPE
jgi:hypothetical protein